MDNARTAYTNDFYASWSTASLLEFVAAHNADGDNALQQLSTGAGTRDEIRAALDTAYVVEGTPAALVHLGKKTGEVHTAEYHGAAFTDDVHSDGIVSHTATTAGDHPSPAASALTLNTTTGDFLLHPGGDAVEHLTGRASPTQPHILRVAAAWNLGEPTSIRDAPADGGPARYLASSSVKLSTETAAAGAAPRSFKWASDAYPEFQINMERIAGVPLETGARPPLATPQGWNGDRWSSTTVFFSGMATPLNAAYIHPTYPDVFVGIKGDALYHFDIPSGLVSSAVGSIATIFPEAAAGGSPIKFAHRASAKDATTFWQLYLFDETLTYWRYEWAGPGRDDFTFLATAQHSWKTFEAMTTNNGLIFKEENGIQKYLDGGYVPYGPGTSDYTSLPNSYPIDSAVLDIARSRAIVTIGTMMYILDTTAKTVTSSFPFGEDITVDNHLNAGNFVDGKDYTLKIDTSAATMPVQTYGQATVQEAVDWTCDSVWGHTVWRGTIVEASGQVRFILTTGAGGKGAYRPWPGEPNAQEAYTAHGVGAVTLEVSEYVYTGSLASMAEGAELVPVLETSRGGPDAGAAWLTRTDGQPWATKSDVLDAPKAAARLYNAFARAKHFV